MAQRTKHQQPGGKKHNQTARRRSTAPKTAAQFFAKSEPSQDRWNRIAHVISKMRAEGVSLRGASTEYRISPRTVARLGGAALRKKANGRYVAKRSDQLLRVLTIPEAYGVAQIAVRGSREASRLGQYWAALQRYSKTGDATALLKFRNQSIKGADGSQIPLITDLALLRRLGGAGEFSFESLYGRVA